MKKTLILSVVILMLLSNCTEKNEIDSMVIKESIKGSVQKGPFINGTNITISELDKKLSQTGKTFNTQIVNNQGSFEINNIQLKSGYVYFRADGFYFNEVLGEQSNSQISLYAISDVSDKSTINVNILSHLEKPRVEYLISEGANFQEAKKQAQREVLAIFGYSLSSAKDSELLDISKEGDENAILLASSLILQGYRSEAELTELLSNISLDLREDGILSNTALGSTLINHAVSLNLTQIRTNLENRYAELAVNASIPNFENYIQYFNENTDFEITESLIEYPEIGIYGENILDVNQTTFLGSSFSLAANLTKGMNLTIQITDKRGDWFGYSYGTGYNWSISTFDQELRTQYYTAIETGKECELNMVFDSGEYLIEYFEMDSETPTRTKTITVTN